jgi:hypothetical protein
LDRQKHQGSKFQGLNIMQVFFATKNGDKIVPLPSADHIFKPG